MDGIIQIILGGIMLYVAFGIVKQIAKTAFYVTAIAAVLILLWGAADAVGIDLSAIFAFAAPGFDFIYEPAKI